MSESADGDVYLSPHRGTTILVCGIVSLVCCFLCGIPAWVMGDHDLREMEAGRMDPSGEGVTRAGKICGIVGLVLGLLGSVVGVLSGLLGALAG